MHNLATKAVAGVRAQPLRLWLALGLMLVACSPTLASPFYTPTVVAQTGTGRFTAIDSHCSINEQNNIAFIATDNLGGRGIFFSQGGATPTLVAYGNFRSVWLNNLDQIAAVFEATSGANHVATVRRYSYEGGVWVSTTVAKASTAMRTTTYNPCAPVGGYCPFTIRERVEPFDDILTEISMNDAGRVTFTGVLGNQAYLTVQDSYRNDIGPSLSVSASPQPAWQPVIDNNNHILIRAGNLSTSSILYYPLLFTSAGLESIATELGGFTRIGRSPGVSDDGTAIVFYGELSVAGAQARTLGNGSAVPIAVTPGPGIFASVKIGNSRRLVRLAGVAGNDQLDPGERWLEMPDATGHQDRGQDFNFDKNQKSDWEIGAFEPDFRIAVSGIKPFADPTKGSNITVVFVGTNSIHHPDTGQIIAQHKALFSARLNLFRDSSGDLQTAGSESPMLVAEEDDNPQNAFEAIKKLNITDAVSKEGHILFSAEGAANKAIILATRKVNSDNFPGRGRTRFDPDSPVAEYVAPGASSGSRGGVPTISQIILHATADAETGSLKTLTGTEVSVHYLVSLEGRITQIIEESRLAFHAANCSGDDQQFANKHSIGIELVDGPGDRNYYPQWVTDVQLRRAALLVRDIARRNQITEDQNGRAQIIHPAIAPYLAFAVSSAGGPRLDMPGYLDGMRGFGVAFSEAPWVPALSFQTRPTFSSATTGLVWDVPNPLGCKDSSKSDTNPDLRYTDGYGPVTGGVLGHGQVLDRTRGRNDPAWFDWLGFMTMVNQGIGLTLNSPANLLVTDPQGRRTGYDSGSGQTLLEIPGSQFTGMNTEPQSLSIPDATNGNYTVQVVGTSNGVFHLDILASGLDAGLTQTRVAGSTSLGVTTTYTLNHDSVTGDATKVFGATNLPPVAFDDFAQTTTNQLVVINVLENDSDPDAFLNTNSVTVVTNPANGTVSVNPTNGLVTYTPTGVFISTNTFAYTVQDNQGATSTPGLVTIIVTEPVFSTNPPPVAVNDFATSTNGAAISIPVLANDFTTNGILDPSTVTVTLAPTNGSTSVDSFTGEITYTPYPGTTNRDSFRYTVHDDLGTPSNEGIVTVTNIVMNDGSGGNGPLTPIANYLVDKITSGSVDHRYPRINNLGDVVYQSPIDGLQQVWKKPAGVSASQVTFPETNFLSATSPAIADDGSFVAYRLRTNSGVIFESIVKGAGLEVIANGTRRGYPFSEVWLGPYTSMASDGKIIWASTSFPGGIDPGSPTGALLVSEIGTVRSVGGYIGDVCDVNAAGSFVYGNGSQILLNNQVLTNGTQASINDAPRDNPEIVYVNGTNLMSTLFGKLDGGTNASYPLSGSWVDVNSNGVVVFEKLVGGYYQVYKAYPWDARIISRGGTSGLVGLPYKYDGDNVAEAYGGPEPVNDPRGYLPLEWSLVSGPPGFTIDPDSGHINWIPTAPGNYTAVINVWTVDPIWLNETEDTEIINITVAQSTMQVVDAVDFRTPGTPDLPTVPTNYTSGGTSRIGVLADGASRLVLRVPLVGAETNSFPNLHFAIGGTNQLRDGLLRAISGSAWSNDVPVTIANVGGTNMALCLYESPLDLDAASQPVTNRLYNGTNVIATQTIQLRRPPVVLVHDGWSGPDAWPVLMSELFDAGMDVYLVDYEYAAGNSLSASDTKIFLKGNEAIAQARQSGFAASRFDLVGHGSGGILARLHAQRYAAQDTNYRKGDVHKLITIGTPHQGSWLAATVLALRTNNPLVFASLRSAVLSASEAGGYFPPIDLNAGLMDSLAPGSSTLLQLEMTPAPGHAIAATINTLPPGDPVVFIQYYLGLVNQGDGLATTNSAVGGIQTNASTVFTNIAHAYQPTDTNVVARVVTLLRESLSGSNHFGYFPPADVQTNQPAGTVATNIGTWLSLSGATNGQTFNPGQTVIVTAVAGGGHVLQSVQFISPVGSALVTTGAFAFNFQIPTQAVGRVVISAAGRDSNNEVAFASVVLNVTPAFALQSLFVEPSPFVFTVKADQPLRVWGLYADGVQRDLTLGASGTKYKSNVPNVSVNSNGVLHLVPQYLASPVTISITNGTVWTNVQVSAALTNLPPVAVIAANRVSGPAPFDVQFNGTNSVDPELFALSYFWDFGDGATAGGQNPPSHRFFQPGNHVVKLTVTDPSGVVGNDQFAITVEPLLLMIDTSLTLTQRLAYNQSIVTNGGFLSAPFGLGCGDLILTSSQLELGTNSTAGNALITNSRLSASNGVAMTGVVLLAGTNLVVGQGSLGSLTIIGTNTMAGFFRMASLDITNGLVTPPPQLPLDLTVTNRLWVNASSRLDATGMGYPGGTGPGRPPGDGPGASYGGLGGGGSANMVYGLFDAPDEFGSGGWGGGGGKIRLRTGQLQLDGLLAVDGVSGLVDLAVQPGASGGSIWITSGTLLGSGTIRANGGISRGRGGGGGGRVAIYYDDRSGFSGVVQAQGGVGWNINPPYYQGGAGTVYWKKNSQALGELVLDNAGRESQGWSTPLSNAPPVALSSLTMGSGIRLDMQVPLVLAAALGTFGTNNELRLANGSSLNAIRLNNSNSLAVFGNALMRDVSVSNGSSLTITGSVVFQTVNVWSNSKLAFGGLGWVEQLNVRSGSVLAAMAQLPLDLTVTNRLWLDASSRLDATGMGYPAGTGPGRPPGDGPGASYGGLGGGQFANMVYGLFDAPDEFGSGGWGGGGGKIRLRTGQLQLDGLVTADGVSRLVSGAVDPGASGGSIWITTGTLLGSGTIRATGGIALGRGSGGGGRVAIYYDDRSGFSGIVQAQGGLGNSTINQGGAGTVYWKKNNQALGELVLDNAGRESQGWSTPLPLAGFLRLQSWVVSGGARVLTTGGVRVVNGDPSVFQGLITSKYMQVGSLVVSNTWVFGDVIDLSASHSNGVVLVSVICRPQRTYLLLATTDFANWVTVATNTPTSSSFSFVDVQSVQFSKRFFRGVMLDYLFNGIGLSVNRTNRQALLTLQGVQPNHTLLLQASDDLRTWTTISTTTPSAVTNWQFLDTNAPSFNKRFYRATGQSQ